MDLRELLNALWKYRALFVGTIGIFVAAGFLLWAVQPIRFSAEITMNVARTGVRMTNEYVYDDFYRLQADERFADTVVRWLESPRIVGDIAREADVSREKLHFKAARLSSQVIRIRYSVNQEAEANTIAEAVFDVLNRETKSLNRDRSEDGWFALVGEAPALVDVRFGKVWIGATALFLGLFFGFFAVLFRWYWKESLKMTEHSGHENRH